MQTSGQSQPLPGPVLGEATDSSAEYSAHSLGALGQSDQLLLGKGVHRSPELQGQRPTDAEVGRYRGLRSRGFLSSCQTGIRSNKDPVERNTVRPAWETSSPSKQTPHTHFLT